MCSKVKTQYISQSSKIQIDWTVKKGIGFSLEDFTRSAVSLFLIGAGDRVSVACEAGLGTVTAEVVEGLDEGVYSLELLWVKNGDIHGTRCLQRSRIDKVFCITRNASEAQSQDTIAKVKVTTHAQPYGYDGLSAYEAAVLRGYKGSEEDFYRYSDVRGELDSLQEQINDVNTGLDARYTKNETYNKSEVYTKGETYSKSELNNLITTPDTDIIPVTELPASGTEGTIYRLAGEDSYEEYGWDGTQFVLLATKGLDRGKGVLDLSELHASGGTPAQYADLSAALGASGENVPLDDRYGGLSVQFINSSTGKYEQWRLKSPEWSILSSDWENYKDYADRIINGSHINITSLTPFDSGNGYITSQGKWSNVTSAYVFKVIPVEMEGMTYKYVIGDVTGYVAYLSAYQTPVSGEAVTFASGQTGLVSLGRNQTHTGNVPDGTQYILLWVLRNNVDVSPTSIEIAGSEEGLVDKIGDLTMLDTDDKSSLVGAVNELYGRIQPNIKWLALGDSITEGVYTEMEGGEPVSHKNREYSWDAQAAKILGYDLDNRGIGGMGYLQMSPDVNRPLNLRTLLDLDSTSTTHIISQNDPTTYIDLSIYKLITINLGVNDWKSPTTYNKIGTLADDSSVTTSVVGNMRYAIEKIMSVNPNAKIIVFSPINCAWGLSSNPSTADNNWAIGYTGYGTYTLEDVSEVLKSVCDYYGVEYIDLLHTSVVNRLNIMSLLLDKVHPTQVAHQQLAREISRFLA